LKVLKKVVDTIRATIEDKQTARKKFENACENDQAAIIVMVLYPVIGAKLKGYSHVDDILMLVTYSW